MTKIGLPKGSGKRLKVREKSVKSQGILKWILSGNPGQSRSLNDSMMSKIKAADDIRPRAVWVARGGLGA